MRRDSAAMTTRVGQRSPAHLHNMVFFGINITLCDMLMLLSKGIYKWGISAKVMSIHIYLDKSNQISRNQKIS